MEIAEKKVALGFLEAAKKHEGRSLDQALNALEDTSFTCPGIEEKIVEVLTSFYGEDHSTAARVNKLAEKFNVSYRAPLPPSLYQRVTKQLAPLAEPVRRAVSSRPFIFSAIATLAIFHAPEEASPYIAATLTYPIFYYLGSIYQRFVPPAIPAAPASPKVAVQEEEESKKAVEEAQVVVDGVEVEESESEPESEEVEKDG